MITEETKKDIEYFLKGSDDEVIVNFILSILCHEGKNNKIDLEYLRQHRQYSLKIKLPNP